MKPLLLAILAALAAQPTLASADWLASLPGFCAQARSSSDKPYLLLALDASSDERKSLQDPRHAMIDQKFDVRFAPSGKAQPSPAWLVIRKSDCKILGDIGREQRQPLDPNPTLTQTYLHQDEQILEALAKTESRAQVALLRSYEVVTVRAIAEDEARQNADGGAAQVDFGAMETYIDVELAADILNWIPKAKQQGIVTGHVVTPSRRSGEGSICVQFSQAAARDRFIAWIEREISIDQSRKGYKRTWISTVESCR